MKAELKYFKKLKRWCVTKNANWEGPFFLDKNMAERFCKKINYTLQAPVDDYNGTQAGYPAPIGGFGLYVLDRTPKARCHQCKFIEEINKKFFCKKTKRKDGFYVASIKKTSGACKYFRKIVKKKVKKSDMPVKMVGDIEREVSENGKSTQQIKGCRAFKLT